MPTQTQYIDLARAKSEALVNILIVYSKKKKKKFNAKRRQQRERHKKKSIRLISKKTISHEQHTFCTFLCRCFA